MEHLLQLYVIFYYLMRTTYKNELISRDSKGKIRVVYASAKYLPIPNEFRIFKKTGLFKGKLIEQPEKVITEGKAKRTVHQQGDLEYNSTISKYLDKGYKKVEELFTKPLDKLSEEEINEKLPLIKTNADNVPIPMGCKKYTEVATKAFDKEYLASRKLDGVKCIFYQRDGEIRTSSRGGKDYNIAAEHLINDPAMIEIFKKYPDIMLDGEIYKHGWTLQKISGLARTKEITPEKYQDIIQLQYWIYDIADDKMKFEDRWELMQELEPIISKSSHLKLVEQTLISGWLGIDKLNKKYVAEGFEGVVIKRLDAYYGYGKKTNAAIKIKDYKDEEFLIVGWIRGLRPEEDMCFVMETKSGKRFKAKPVGDRNTKLDYIKNMSNIIGHMGTVTYFNMSEGGIPTQPVFKTIRYEEDIYNNYDEED